MVCVPRSARAMRFVPRLTLSSLGSRVLLSLVFAVISSTAAFSQTPENTTFRIGQEVTGVIEPIITVDPGGSGAVEFFLEDEDDEVWGFLLIVEFGEGVTIDDFDITGTIIEAIGAELLLVNVNEDVLEAGTRLFAGMFFDKFPPFAGQTLPPSPVPVKIGEVPFVASPDPRVVPIDFSPGFENTQGTFFENGIFFSNDQVPPGTLVPATIVIGEIEYIRGDCNQDGVIDVGDAVFLLNALFEKGDAPRCADACEMNLDGTVDLADVMGALQFLFAGGPPPSAPFPICASDGDPIGCAEPIACRP